MVYEIVSADILEVSLRSLADRLAAKPPEALLMTKQLLAAEPESVAARIEREGLLFADRLGSSEARQAFAAFLARGKPPGPGNGA